MRALRRRAAAIRWFWRELTGESRYQKYVDAHWHTHAGTTTMTEREFWRHHADHAEATPPTRCC